MFFNGDLGDKIFTRVRGGAVPLAAGRTLIVPSC